MAKHFAAHRPKTAPARPRATPVGASARVKAGPDRPDKPKEIGGPCGPEPTRYGDWERKGICVDF